MCAPEESFLCGVPQLAMLELVRHHDRHPLDHEDPPTSRTRRPRARAGVPRAGLRRPCRLRAGRPALRHPDALSLRRRLSRPPLSARRPIQPHTAAHLATTTVIEVLIEELTAKMREGGPK